MNATMTMRRIDRLDLDPIKRKLMHEPSGEGWSRARADATEVEYRRFLCMLQLYPQEAIAPLRDVDTFWHYHILDTRKYAADCQQAFGQFIHHHPYVGLGEDDATDHQQFGERMQALYMATFGEPCLAGARANNGATATAWCSLTAARTKTAWCSLNAGKEKTAWCSLNASAGPALVSPARSAATPQLRAG